MKGFFAKSELLVMNKNRPAILSARCELCRLYKGCNSPKMPATGEGRLGVLVVAEAPGKTEDERNEQLIGKAGQRLRRELLAIDIDLDRDCWKTNALICRPPNNRTPSSEELGHCRPNLTDTIKKYQPHTIIVMGDSALNQVLDPYWGKDFGVFGRWVGERIPLQPLNTWICPTWHPSYIERMSSDKNGAMYALWFGKHLKAAFELNVRPWKEVPDYKSLVEKLDDASTALLEMKNYVGMAAIDYETNMLKPEGNKAVPVSVSITWGKSKVERCIAYPLTPNNKELTREFLRSSIPKIAANMKFEQRWSMRHFNTPVRNWFWDTMQCAHTLDNRDGVTSLDFQAFTKLGLPTYSDHISSLLKAKGSAMTVNQILSEISVPQLLEYNGLDTITEFSLAVLQMKELGERPPWRT